MYLLSSEDTLGIEDTPEDTLATLHALATLVCPLPRRVRRVASALALKKSNAYSGRAYALSTSEVVRILTNETNCDM